MPRKTRRQTPPYKERTRARIFSLVTSAIFIAAVIGNVFFVMAVAFALVKVT